MAEHVDWQINMAGARGHQVHLSNWTILILQREEMPSCRGPTDARDRPAFNGGWGYFEVAELRYKFGRYDVLHPQHGGDGGKQMCWIVKNTFVKMFIKLVV